MGDGLRMMIGSGALKLHPRLIHRLQVKGLPITCRGPQPWNT